ncbi:hypothetical protein [Caulobacter mirabilis]|uniref:DUF4136 domain-containing protein n=1 Tax=Caulobacter mirabilis TaxID=69666 RepID=A0A2D2ASN7_9CAUL|nr:hypothetical protein [Caulobacter mirabilis]ATQ41022.1 hypothetical protein CSW64_00675 [Caulobacter mirabilis]
MRVPLLLAAALCLGAGGCAMGPMAVQGATLDNVQAARAATPAPVAVGAFVLAEGLPKAMDRSIAIRAGSVTAPGGGSFAGYLKTTLETELTAAGKLDAASGTTISGELTQSSVATPLPMSRGLVGARFRVTRDGKVLYEKELTASDEWESNFIGAVAIPMAMDRYTALYPKLVGVLLNDPEFRAALRRP